MAKLHSLGFPRIGRKRELKFALEQYWRGEIDQHALHDTAANLRARHWAVQQGLDYVPVGDHSLYDHVLDTSVLVGNLPARAKQAALNPLDQYFTAARGRSVQHDSPPCCTTHAAEMTKWFDTNYHYLVPEFSADTAFTLQADNLLAQVREARTQGVNVKPVLLGPVTYLWLGKAKDNSDPRALLPALLPVYKRLLDRLAAEGVSWVQIDEPALVTELDDAWLSAYETAYQTLSDSAINCLLTTYFGALKENISTVVALPVAGVHIDAVRAPEEVAKLDALLAPGQVLSVGVIDGRNIWTSDLKGQLAFLKPLAERRGDNLWIAPSCSLLHVPVDLASEGKIIADLRPWLAFAHQKVDELVTLGQALNAGEDSVREALDQNQQSIVSRKQSTLVHNPTVKLGVEALDTAATERSSPYSVRAEKQAAVLPLPLYPTTTIGSFPQTSAIRTARLALKKGELDQKTYQQQMQAQIKDAVQRQEALGLDVLVHGEAERNDMVEYFGEQLDGYLFTQFGWVQSYGSRCVKPPIIYGDIARPEPMTVAWSTYAQSLTDKPMKGMLTGPVTMLNWSFVRDDQSREVTCYQLALAIRQEVKDLEQAGIKIIQIDEAALREGLPLRRSEWDDYLRWAVTSFKISASGVADETQIHTHMCYSEFNDIIESISQMDADVITIETSRSDMELLDAFDAFNYPSQIGPGVYDIHSPNIPTVESMVQLMQQAAGKIPAQRLWVNPDCGLKTRQWDEVIPALENMMQAAYVLRRTQQ